MHAEPPNPPRPVQTRPTHRAVWWAGAGLLAAAAAGFCLLGLSLECQGAVSYWPAEISQETQAWTGRLERVEGPLALLTVRGTPEERGTAHGRLLRAEVRKLVQSVRSFLRPSDKEAGHYAQCLEGARAMRRHIEAAVLAELGACARAAEVDAEELLLAQLFGDVNRAKGFASFCSSFAAFGPATSQGQLIVGRNFDYAGHGLEGGLPIVLQEIPAEGKGGREAPRPFVTIGYAGILNGWTAMNADGLCVCNNTLFGGVDALEGLSTCFLLRQIVEHARTVAEGVAIIEQAPRACTTGMLVAGRNAAGAWDARFVEFDAKSVAVVEPKDGRVLATNTRQKLAASGQAPPAEVECGRYQALKKLLVERAGRLSFAAPAAETIGAKGVYLDINLHCALLDPAAQRLRLAVSPGGASPAATHPFRDFQVQAARVLPEPAAARP